MDGMNSVHFKIFNQMFCCDFLFSSSLVLCSSTSKKDLKYYRKDQNCLFHSFQSVCFKNGILRLEQFGSNHLESDDVSWARGNTWYAVRGAS